MSWVYFFANLLVRLYSYYFICKVAVQGEDIYTLQTIMGDFTYLYTRSKELKK